MSRRPAAPVSRHRLETFKLTAEKMSPTRARAVLWYLDFAMGTPAQSRKDRRRSERQGKRHAHPARRRHRLVKRNVQMMTAAEREREKAARRMGGMLREELAVAGNEDGEVAGPLRVVARFATPHLLEDFDLDPGKHTVPFEHWLMARLGDVLREPDVVGYLQWRDEVRERVTGRTR